MVIWPMMNGETNTIGRSLNMKKHLIQSLLLLACVSAHSKSYVCTPADAQTQLTYMGKLFSLSIDSRCMKLRSLEDKTRSWHWKVTLTNTLGDAEGSRHFCDQKDDGFIGSPAIWRMSAKKLYIFQTQGLTGPDVLTFECQANPTN